MKLLEIAKSAGRYELCGNSDLEISALCCDSRKSVSGCIFVALSGINAEGRDFCGEAIAKGAQALVVEEKLDFPVAQIVVPDARLALSRMAEFFYKNPSDKLNIAGITGTNGKTTTAFLVKHILTECNIKCGMLGTVFFSNGSGEVESEMTTPDSIVFSRYLSEMVDNNCQAAVVEVSSHSLAQHRVAGTKFKVGVFTNLTRDHLDYHGSMENYGKTKSLLFRKMSGDSTAVLNADESYSAKIAEETNAQILWYSLDKRNGLSAQIEDMSLAGSRLTFEFREKAVTFETSLVGRHNVYNMLAAVLCCFAMGVDFEESVNALKTFAGVPGRLQRVANKKGVNVFIDYAHTDDALRNVLSIIKPLCVGKVITVFGCGGDRDRGKRPMMAEVAEKYSDLVYITNDNPRTEDAVQIMSDIKSGFRSLDNVIEKLDRQQAVECAVRAASAEDVVIIAGKGHEKYQVIGTEKIHMDDYEMATTALE